MASKTYNTNADLNAAVDHDFFDDPTPSSFPQMSVTISKKKEYDKNLSEDSDSNNINRPTSKREGLSSKYSDDSYSSDYSTTESEYSTSLSPTPRFNNEAKNKKENEEEEEHKTPGRPPSGRNSNTKMLYSKYKKRSSSPELTDVSPVNSPKLQKKTRPRSAVTFKDNPPETDNDAVDMRILVQALLEMEKKKDKDQRFISAEKKNYSFNNARFREINAENERLMRRIIDKTKQAAEQTISCKSSTKQIKATGRMTPSAVNRKKQQDRIQQENMALLKRLESAKATKDLQRDNLMKQYNKKTICGIPIAAAHSPFTQKQLQYENTEYLYSRQDTNSNCNNRSRPSSAKKSSRPTSAKNSTRPNSRPTSAKIVKEKTPWQDGW